MKLLYLANLIACFCIKRGYDVNHNKIHNLLYLYQGWHLSYLGYNPYMSLPIATPKGPRYLEIDEYLDEVGYNCFSEDIAFNEELDKTYQTLVYSIKMGVEQKHLLRSVLTEYASSPEIVTHLAMMIDEAWLDARYDLTAFENGPTMSEKLIKKSFKRKHKQRTERKEESIL
jgi:hypothetical protein